MKNAQSVTGLPDQLQKLQVYPHQKELRNAFLLIYYMFTFDQQMIEIQCKQYSKLCKSSFNFPIFYSISFYFTSLDCIFSIYPSFSIQYMTYYIPLESSDFPLSNGIVVKVKFPHIFYLLKNILSISGATSAIQNTRIQQGM